MDKQARIEEKQREGDRNKESGIQADNMKFSGDEKERTRASLVKQWTAVDPAESPKNIAKGITSKVLDKFKDATSKKNDSATSDLKDKFGDGTILAWAGDGSGDRPTGRKVEMSNGVTLYYDKENRVTDIETHNATNDKIHIEYKEAPNDRVPKKIVETQNGQPVKQIEENAQYPGTYKFSCPNKAKPPEFVPQNLEVRNPQVDMSTGNISYTRIDRNALTKADEVQRVQMNADGSTKAMDDNHRLKAMTDANGVTYEFEYTSDNNADKTVKTMKVTDAEGKSYTYQRNGSEQYVLYDSGGNRVASGSTATVGGDASGSAGPISAGGSVSYTWNVPRTAVNIVADPDSGSVTINSPLKKDDMTHRTDGSQSGPHSEGPTATRSQRSYSY